MPAAAHHLLACLDLDGCLVDSRFAITSCIADAFIDLGLPRPAQAALTACIGPPLDFAIPNLLDSIGLDRDDIALRDQLIAGYRGRYATVSLTKTPVVEGIEAALCALAEAGVGLIVVTSKPVIYAAPIINAVGLQDWFLAVHGPSADRGGETKTVTLRRALNQHPARVAVMVGDRHHDIDAATENQVASVGVTWGIGDHAELSAAGADIIINQPADLPQAIAKFAASTQN